MQGWGVRAIQADMKTKTRRSVVWSNSYVDGQVKKFWREHWHELDFSRAWLDNGPSPAGNPGPYLHVPFPPDGTILRIYPQYQVGDLIWIKETFSFYDAKHTKIQYQADLNGYHKSGGWHSSIFMPKKYARLWLRITNVRGERVQEIDEDDAEAEGMPPAKWTCLNPGIGSYAVERYARDDFQEVWDSINAKRGYPWESNHYVWVLEFERHDRQL